MATTRNFSDIRKISEYTGTGTDDNDVMITVSDAREFDSYILMSSVGVADVQVTLDGTNWSTAPIAMSDLGATTVDPALVTVAGRAYGFRGLFRSVRVLQNGVTGATASLMCGRL